jgi:hypothetical protein
MRNSILYSTVSGAGLGRAIEEVATLEPGLKMLS